MLEGCLKNGEVLRKLRAAISDLVTDANFDCREQGMSLQVRVIEALSNDCKRTATPPLKKKKKGHDFRTGICF